MKKHYLIGAFVIGFLASHSAGAQTRDQVKLGWLASLTDTALFVAIKKGYFTDERIDVVTTGFRSGANMVVPLGTGELDVGAGSPSAGLYNAIARGVTMFIVADKTRSSPGYGGSHMLVRKDLIDSGRVKDLKDLKGLRVALNGPGNSNTATLNYALASAGLKYSDVIIIDLNMPDHVTALANKSIDASNGLEPFASTAIARGIAVRFRSDDQIDPHHQLANILFSDNFAKKPDIGVRFMRGYLRGARFYLGALKDGKLAGKNADEVIAILTEFTAVKDPEVLRNITPSGIDPNGEVNVASLQKDLDFYATQGWITGKVDLGKVVDHSFVRAAAKSLASE